MGHEISEMKQTRSGAKASFDTKPNEHIQKLKMVTKMHWEYSLNYLKHPSKALKQDEKEFMNSMVNIIILAVFVGLAFSLLDSLYEVPFFSTLGSALLFVLISAAIVSGSVCLTIKFLGSGQSFKSIVGIYGTHLIPSTFLVVIASILLLLKGYTFGSFLLSFALLLAFLIVPLYILILLLKQEETMLDPLYCVIVYITIFGIAFSIFLILLGDSGAGHIMSRLYLLV
ncbi:hypothetical protein [Sporosarcina sp. ANT_H38]|uniref:hypothetical protein n=1 Tax=Sporosarcina sp. ANT_H38 TaxID=2597358 RepID=UPI0039820658